MKMNRRDFVKYSIGGLATVVVGSQIPWLRGALALTTQTLNVTITDAVKGMATDNPGNPAKCYFWVYKMSTNTTDMPADVPGPILITTKGDTIPISITNNLDEPHAFSIPGVFDSGSIAPGSTVNLTIDTTNASSGAHLYYDNLNAPVNRMMGLHGAFIVMPAAPVAGHRYTPYDNPSPGVQKLYDDFGTIDPATGLGSTHFPGIAWEQEGVNPAPYPATPAFRQYVWLLHQASPKLFASVGNNETITFTTTSGETVTGRARDPVIFMKAFLHDAFNPVHDPFNPQLSNNVPQYFTISGQSGHYSHNNPYICPNLRVGEPCVIHVMNAGLWSHSMHLHANHFYVTSENGVVSTNPIWVDVFNIEPMDMIDYTIPYMRPPDIPNERGIGNVDLRTTANPAGKDFPLTSLANPNIPGSVPHPTWPPTEELAMFMPKQGTTAGVVSIAVQLSPLCYPMHDHSEPSQTAQGGNYNLGMISGINFTGDRNLPDADKTFPNAPTVFGPDYKKWLQYPAGGI